VPQLTKKKEKNNPPHSLKKKTFFLAQKNNSEIPDSYGFKNFIFMRLNLAVLDKTSLSPKKGYSHLVNPITAKKRVWRYLYGTTMSH